MESQAPSNTPTRGVLSFHFGSICLGARIEEVLGLLDADRVVALPRQMEGVAGLVAFRGDMVPLLDLARYLGMEPPAASNACYIVVLGRGADRFGVLVPELPKLLHPRDLGEAGLSTTDPELGALIASVYQAEGRSVHCLNYWHIFDGIIPPAGTAGAGSKFRA
jgi:chemotaxis signal transduction protein